MKRTTISTLTMPNLSWRVEPTKSGFQLIMEDGPPKTQYCERCVKELEVKKAAKTTHSVAKLNKKVTQTCQPPLIKEVLQLTAGAKADHVRKLAIKLAKVNYSSQKIAQMISKQGYKVLPTTIGAWRAHETRGTYKYYGF